MNSRILIALAISWAAVTVSAQVIIRGAESSDKSATHQEVNIATMDRDIVPIIKETKTTKEDKNTERTESVTRARLNDGSYLDWQRSTTIKKEAAPGVTEVSTVVLEQDRQGGDRTAQRTTETTTKTASGEKSEAKVYTRNSSGELVLDRVVAAKSVKDADGRTNTTRVEQALDVNGNPVLKKQVEEVAVDRGANEKVITSRTKAVDHVSGRLSVTEEATTVVRTEGGTKQIETVVRIPGRAGWQVNGRTTTTETTAPDGSVSRDTIEQGRSLYSTRTGDETEPLAPQRKIVERETRRPDGTVTLQRDVFRRDVNGDWKPESFSTKQPGGGN